MEKNLTVVIRSIGERTEGLCRKLISRQISEKNIITINKTPFSAALADSYRAGIQRGLKWTLCVDADLLLRPDAIMTLLKTGNESEDNVFLIQGLILDKFFGGPRPAGNPLYRTALLHKALELIPQEETSLRPERDTLRRMEEKGYLKKQIPVTLGLHDFEQYYKDIYRKCFIQAHKHDYRLDFFVSYWRRLRDKDFDFQVALTGLSAGILAERQEARIDARKFPASLENITSQEIKEKSPISKDFLIDVEKVISEWREPEEYKKYFSATSYKTKKYSKQERLSELKKQLGILQLIIWLLGWLLYKTGLKIKNSVDRYKKSGAEE